VSAALVQHWATPGPGRNLQIALGASLFIHAALLTLHFDFPDAARILSDKALMTQVAQAGAEVDAGETVELPALRRA